MFYRSVVCLVLVASVRCSTSSSSSDGDESDILKGFGDLLDEDDRQIVITGTGIGIGTGFPLLNLNLTQIAALSGLFASGLVTLLGLASLAFITYYIVDESFEKYGYGSGSGYYDSGSSYSSYR